MLTQIIDVDKASSKIKEQLLNLVPTYESLASASKIHLVQSIISRLLVDQVFEEYFIGLPKSKADELRSVEKYLQSFGKERS